MNIVQKKALKNILSTNETTIYDEHLGASHDIQLLLDEVHVPESTESKMRDIIRRVVRGNRNLSWQEFESFFCQSQGNFSALLLSLPKNKQEAEKFGKLTRAKASSDDDTKEEFTVDDDLEEEALERLEDDMFDGDEDDEIQEYMIIERIMMVSSRRSSMLRSNPIWYMPDLPREARWESD